MSLAVGDRLGQGVVVIVAGTVVGHRREGKTDERSGKKRVGMVLNMGVLSPFILD